MPLLQVNSPRCVCNLPSLLHTHCAAAAAARPSCCVTAPACNKQPCRLPAASIAVWGHGWCLWIVNTDAQAALFA